jgi:5-methylcytosine-specific restriction endonuclease McrA
MQHADLSDEELVSQLASLCLEGRRLVARVIVHLTEVEDRGVDKKAACSSMWDFCLRRLGMSEGETSRRLNAVKLVRRFPSLLGRIERGEIHLSTLKILGRHLDESNLDELLEAARGKTRMQVKELVASRHPRPDAPTMVTELPAALVTLPLAGAEATPAEAPARPSRVEPLSASRYLVQTTLSKAAYDDLQRAKELARHRIPSGDTAEILERALALLVTNLEKERLARTSRPQRRARPSKAGHVAAAVRREVFERDGEQCTYADAEGRRCECRTLLELDHVIPRAHGGADDAANLRVRCRAHNRMYAEEVFGKEYVAERIHCRQHQAQRVMATSPANATATMIDQATRGLVNMGFAKSEATRAVDGIVRKHPQGDVQRLLREAIAVLT